jgi:predicted transcriptional regulator
MSKNITVYVDDEMHKLVGLLAEKHSTSMSRLVLAAIEDAYEDDIDSIAGERGLKEHLADPNSGINWDELKRQLKANLQTKEPDS